MLRSVHRFFRETPGVILAIVGLACAFMVLEIQRMPVARFVSFSMFAPLPYIVEATVMLAIVAWQWARPALRLGDSRAVRTIVALLVLASTGLLLYAPLEDDGVTLGVLMTYRASTGMLVVLWGERLVSLGARRAGFAVALSCMLSGAATSGLAFFSSGAARALLGMLPLLAGGLFVAYRPRVAEEGAKSGADADGLRRSLPRFACSSAKDRAVAVGLVTLPLVCRGPMVMFQSSWMGLQGDAAMSSLIQASIGCGIVLAGLIALLVVRHVWSQSFVLVYELFVLPVTFVSFYTAQTSDDLWFLHMLIVDSTYKVTLFYIMMTPFLFPERPRGSSASVYLLASFAFMIAMRALFVGLEGALPKSAYAALTAVVVLASFVGGGLLSFMILQRQSGRREAVRAAAAEAMRASLEKRCKTVADRFDCTPREREILVLLAQNYRAPYIAEKLVVSQSTVKTHMRNLYGKLGVHSQAELLLRLEEEAENITAD